jgi:hypothetical protein
LLMDSQATKNARHPQANEHGSKENIMSALRKMQAYETTDYAAAPARKSAGWLPVVIVTANGTAAYEPAVAVVAEENAPGAAKNIALFLAAPVIGLLYLIAMPFVALAALAWVAGKALVAKIPAIRTAALVIAAPFIGLAFILTAPLLGLGALAWVGTRSLATR